MSRSWAGFLITTVPIVGLSVVSAAAGPSSGLFGIWAAGVGLEVVGFVVAIVLSALHVRLANGFWTGLGVGFVALIVACFVGVARK